MCLHSHSPGDKSVIHIQSNTRKGVDRADSDSPQEGAVRRRWDGMKETSEDDRRRRETGASEDQQGREEGCKSSAPQLETN
jgi:hypothetical protein